MLGLSKVALRRFSAAAAPREFKNIGVIGLGLMGHGIAQVTAAAGFKVTAVEASEGALTRGMDYINKSLATIVARDVKKGVDKAAAEAKAAKVLGNIKAGTDKGALAGCDLIIEAAPEDLAMKEALYKQLHGIISSDAVVATNTSGLELSELSGFFGAPERLIGLHYFNPVVLMQLVEVVAQPCTPQATTDAAIAFVKATGKVPVLVKDSPGFIVNRLLVPYMAQALALLDRGIASAKDIDAGMKLGCGHPMGPIQLADYVGLDTTLFILQNWTKKYPNEPAFFIPASLKQRVAEGKLGRKTGEGYYRWNGNQLAE